MNVSQQENSLEKSPRTTSVVANQLVAYVPDHVEGLVKKIEKNGSGESTEDDVTIGEKRRRQEGGTPEEVKRASKISMSKIGGGSRITPPTNLKNLIM